MSEPPPVETHDLTKRFGSLTALDRLTLTLEPGEVFGYLGPNGAGKTTTIRMLLGLAKPSAGAAHIFGLDAWTQSVAAHRRLAYVPGETNVWPRLRGGEIVDMLGNAHGGFDPTVRDDLYERFQFDPTRRGREYSKGNRQKIGLVAALMVQPDLLVLDEPTSGLDPLMETVFRDCIREAKARGQTVLLSSHILGEVEAVCDRIGILREGTLVEVGRLAALRHLSARTVQVTFGGTAPDLARVPGVQNINPSGDGHVFTFQLQGSPEPLLRAIADAGVTSIDIAEPSLEQLFLTYYGPQPHDGDGARR